VLLVVASTAVSSSGNKWLEGVASLQQQLLLMAMNVSLAHETDAEVRTRVQLEGLLNAYDLQAWQFTDKVVIDETSIPHSHPVLTLHTRHLNDDLLLLSTYLHEQLHWFVSAQPDERLEPAIKALMTRYPDAPVGFPEGAEEPLSTYFHYLICYLEYLSVRQVAGESEAQRVMLFWESDHYTKIYRTVIRDGDAIGAIARQHRLLPPSLDSAR